MIKYQLYVLANSTPKGCTISMYSVSVQFTKMLEVPMIFLVFVLFDPCETHLYNHRLWSLNRLPIQGGYFKPPFCILYQ